MKIKIIPITNRRFTIDVPHHLLYFVAVLGNGSQWNRTPIWENISPSQLTVEQHIISSIFYAVESNPQNTIEIANTLTPPKTYFTSNHDPTLTNLENYNPNETESERSDETSTTSFNGTIKAVVVLIA